MLAICSSQSLELRSDTTCVSVHDTDRIKRLIIAALVSDDELVGTLVLKGGNALSLAHKLESRASFDLDFSMEGEFD